MDNVVLRLLKYALYLGAIGRLADATMSMRHEAFQASSQGLVSLRALNHALVDRPRK